jgi:hypothetical protein
LPCTSTLPSCDTMLMTLSLYFNGYVSLFSLVGSTVFNGIQAVDADQPGKQSKNTLFDYLFIFNPMYCTFYQVPSLLWSTAWCLGPSQTIWRLKTHSMEGSLS